MGESDSETDSESMDSDTQSSEGGGDSSDRGRIPFHVGDKVSAKWREEGPHQGQWYGATIKSLRVNDRTAHVRFDDGDEDDELPWTDIIVQDSR